MGQNCSEMVPKEMQCLFDTGKHALVSERASLAEKSQALQAVKKDDKILLKRLLYQVPPTENLFKPGSNQTLLHFAAALNSYKAMSACLTYIDANDHDNYNQVINIPDAGLRSPAMVCAGNNAPDSLYVLIEGGGVNFQLRDRENKSLEEIAKEKSPECLVVIEHFRDPSAAGNMDIPARQGGKDARKGAELIKEIQAKLNPEPAKSIDPFLISNPMKKVDPSKRIQNPEAQGVPQDSDTYAILENCIKDKKNFDDANFPHNIASITPKATHENYELFKKCVWVRPEEIFGCKYTDIKLFDGINPNDIKQGFLGVCYFLSAMCALAEFPDRIDSMYLNEVSNQYGVYGIRFIIQGVPREIIVDDWFPCQKNGNQYNPIFSRPNGRELWTMLAEKAWAKLFGNYCVCEAGLMDEAFEYLLGEPAYRGYLEDEKPDEVWKILTDADKRKWILCAASKSQEEKKTGIQAGHAYTIISCHEIDNLRLLKLRNPWGRVEWQGDFSDKSDKWTDDLKVAVGWSDAEDGIFFMPIEDFCKTYSYYSVGVHEEKWFYNYAIGDYVANHPTHFTFTAQENFEGYFRIHFKDMRFMGGENSGFGYPLADFIIARKEADGSYTNIVTDHNEMDISSDNRTVFPTRKRRLQLTKGDYVLRVRLQPGKYPIAQFTVSAYTSTKVELKKAEFNKFLRYLYTNQAKKLTEEQKRKIGNNCFLSNFISGNNVVVAAENKGTLKWKLEVKFTKKDNLKLGKVNRHSDFQFKMEIAPGKIECCYLKKLDLSKGYGITWEINTSWA